MQIMNNSYKPAFSGVFNLKGPVKIPGGISEHVLEFRSPTNSKGFKFLSAGGNIKFSVRKKSDGVVKEILDKLGLEYKYEDIHGVRDERILGRVI